MTGWSLILCLGCTGDDGTPAAGSPAAFCLDDKLVSGFGAIEAADGEDTAVGAEDLRICMEAATDTVLKDGQHAVHKTRTEMVRRLAGETPEEKLALALVRADAVDSYARVAGKNGDDTQLGYTRFEALLESTEKDGATEAHQLVETWYRHSRAEQLTAGTFMVESEDHVLVPSTVHAIAGSGWDEPVAQRLGRQVIVHNALLRPDCKEDPAQRSGDSLARSMASDDLDPTAHRKLLLRVPGTRECTVAALAWDDSQATFVGSIQPATLHTCEGRVVATGGETPARILRLDSCRADTERTDRLQRKRLCTVCGTRDDEKVCHDSHGRNDRHATSLARTAVCEELLGFDEDPKNCPAVVKLDSRCVRNEDDFPRAPSLVQSGQP